ncbi:NADH-flavin reductase [Colwellia sp. 75C3]|uniref:NAD(P)-dependent oxidoreductase n=1 Tax=Colwellia sp. 75C3 TaxID=888425 RepID=UPI000C33261F|nr:NAD(P)H-binding protein [Colwellia sp. 75C3]PKG82894.1 NADH-flavin reductase [Colwellia sp. 75C3]
MKITIFGATGNVGTRVIKEALLRGHEITAVLRNNARANEFDTAVNVVIGHADNVDDVIKWSDGQDIVISTTRPPQGQENQLVDTAKALLSGLEQTQVRLLLVGGAASLTVPNSQGILVVDDANLVQPAWRDIALACLAQHNLCQENESVNWSYLSPPAIIKPGERTGIFRTGTDELLVDEQGQSTISFEDFAIALLDEAESEKNSRKRFTVAY